MTRKLSEAAAAMGRAGKGAVKVRGDAGHYRALQAKALHARRVKAARKILAGPCSPHDWGQIRETWGEDVLRDALKD